MIPSIPASILVGILWAFCLKEIEGNGAFLFPALAILLLASSFATFNFRGYRKADGYRNFYGFNSLLIYSKEELRTVFIPNLYRLVALIAAALITHKILNQT